MLGTDYNKTIVDVIKKLKGNICYVTTNKTYDSLKELFTKKKISINNVVFIDSISKTLKKTPDQSDNVYYVSSPGALTELDLVIGKFLRHEFDYLVFDSLTNLVIYNKMNTCSKFLTSLINKIKKTKTKAVFYALESKEQTGIIDHASTIVDKVIKV